MIPSRRRFITLIAGCALGVGTAKATANGARWQGTALGAHADLRIVGLPARDAEHLVMVARAEIERLEKQFSLYRADSLLVHLNSTGELRGPPPDMLELCSQTSAVYDVTNGLFDPTIQPLWSVYAEAGGSPTGEAVDRARSLLGWHKVEISSDNLRLPDGGSLTFNGIAQGFITDKVVRLLKTHGVEAGLISVGEIAAIGAKSNGVGWPVGLSASEDGAPDSVIALRDEAVATSSSLGTVLSDDGTSHILDARTGLSAPHRWARVSVVHSSAAIADGLSTAAVLMTPDVLGKLPSKHPGLRINAQTRTGEIISV